MTVIKEVLDSDTLVVAFTGYAGKLHLSAQDFFDKAGLAHASKLAIYDRSYMQALNGIEPDIKNFAEFRVALTNAVNSIDHEKLIFVGTSGGGHPALLHAHLLKAQRAVVFACYPYLSLKTIQRMNDPVEQTMSRLAGKFDELPASVRKYLDLADVLDEWNGVTEYDVHVSKHNEWDRKRALYLEGLPNVRIHQHEYSSHGIASELAKEGLLKDCF